MCQNTTSRSSYNTYPDTYYYNIYKIQQYKTNQSKNIYIKQREEIKVERKRRDRETFPLDCVWRSVRVDMEDVAMSRRLNAIWYERKYTYLQYTVTLSLCHFEVVFRGLEKRDFLRVCSGNSDKIIPTSVATGRISRRS